MVCAPIFKADSALVLLEFGEPLPFFLFSSENMFVSLLALVCQNLFSTHENVTLNPKVKPMLLLRVPF